MQGGLIVFAVAIAIVDARPISFDVGTEYHYDYSARIHMDNVHDFQIQAQVFLTNLEYRDSGQEIGLRIEKFTLKALSDSSDNPTAHDDYDFTKWFSFLLTKSGEVINVYYPNDETSEILTIKKGITNMLSGKFLDRSKADHIDREGKWFYKTVEIGHEGEHNASYSVESMKDEHVYSKYRTNSDSLPQHARSNASKTVVINHGLGRIHSVSSTEHAEIIHKTQPGFDPFKGMRDVKPVSDFENVDIPGMYFKSNSNLVFKGTKEGTPIPEKPENLKPKSINHDDSHQVHFNNHDKQGENVTTLLKNVETNLKCIKDQPANGSSALLACSTDLVKTLLALPEGELESLVERIFSTQSNMYLEDTIYYETIIDSLYMMNTELSQLLITKHTLEDQTIDRKLFQRSIFHLGSLESPPHEVMLRFVDNVLQEDAKVLYERYGSENFHIMLLSFGSLSHRLLQNGQGGNLPEKFNKKIKEMLGVHDPYTYRKKRSALTTTEAEDFDWRKVVYLEALGNERHPSSFEHIVSHVNSSSSSWIKRAAVNALRHFNHTKAAKAILVAATEDDNMEVRHEALLAYQAHPASDKAIAARFKRSRESEENAVGPHSRDKRGFLDKEFRWRLEVPGVDWRKTVGSSSIGGAFGVVMMNNFDLKISPLSSHFKIVVHDEVYARVTLGFLGLWFDYYSARVCFKGGAWYEFNILQISDYLSENAERIAKKRHTYRENAQPEVAQPISSSAPRWCGGVITGRVKEYDPRLNTETLTLVTEGIMKVANTIRKGLDMITDLMNGDINFKGIIEDFGKEFRELPNMVLEIRDSALQAVKDFGTLVLEKLPPFLKPMQELITYVADLMGDIKTDVIDFFYSLVQTIETTIPHAAKQIFKSVKSIVKDFPNLFKDPKKSLARMGGNVVKIAFSISELKSVVAKVKNSTMLGDKKPYWMDLQPDFEKIKDLTVSAFTTLLNGAEKWVNATVSDDSIATLTDGEISQSTLREMILDRINAIIERLLAPFERLNDIGDGFLKRFFDFDNLVSGIKIGYNAVKKGFKEGRALIDKVFGPKFHTDFPKLLRDLDTCAKNGFYPSRLDIYQHDGVDLIVNEGAVIVAPLSGFVLRTERLSEVRLVNIMELPVGQEILIQNVELNDNVESNRMVPAGTAIGTATKSMCSNHIHVVLRNEDGVMDPSRLLAPRPPEIPTWTQYCNDKRVVVKGEVKIAEKFIGGEDEKDTSGELDDNGNHPQDVDNNNEPSAGSDGDLYIAVRSKKRKKRSLIDTAESILDMLVTRTKVFLEQFSIRRLKLGQIVDFLKKFEMTESIEKVAGILKRMKSIIDDTQCLAPSEMTNDVLQTQLVNRGLPVSGDRATMIKTLTAPDSRCPLIAMGMRQALYMQCFFSNNCLEMECCVSFEVADMFQKTYKAFFKVDTEEHALYLGVENWRKRISFSLGNGAKDDTIDTGIEFEFLKAAVLCKYKLETTHHQLILTFGCGLCSSKKADVCITFVNIVEDAVFEIPHIAEDGSIVVPEVDFDDYFDRENIKEQLKESADDLLDEGMSNLADMITEALGVAGEFLKSNQRCDIPDNMDDAELKEELENLDLTTTGTREELVKLISTSYTTCTTNNGDTVRFPDVPTSAKDVFTYSISEACMRIDACLDVHLPFINVTKTLTASIELDPCNYKIYLEFENFKKSVWLIDYQWGQESRIALTDKLYIRYIMDKVEKDFILTVSLVCDTISFDSTFIHAFHIPIPICNEDFTLPGTGDLLAFAESMSGKLSQETFDIFTKTLGINDILQNNEICALPSDPTNCDADPSDFVPPMLKPYLRCKMLDNCWGVKCCLDFGFEIPFSNKVMNVSIPFKFKYDPCEYYVEMGVGNSYNMTRWFVEYEWGKTNTLNIGKGSHSPVQLSYSVDKFETGFTIDVQMSICLPLDTSEKHCIPENITLHLLENEHIPACILGIEDTEDGEFPNFSLTEWLKHRGREITHVLGEAGREYVLEALNLDDIVLPQTCDRTRAPYSPSVNGWNIECSLSHIPDLKLPDMVTCHVATDCKTMSCCVDVPQINLSVQITFELDICQNTIIAGLENANNKLENVLSDYKWGENKTFALAKVFQLRYSLTKPATNFYILDVGLRACFEKSKDCLIDTQLVTGLEIPRVYCRTSENVKQRLERISHQCAMDADLQGITCNVYLDDDLAYKAVYFRLEPCRDRYIYSINDLRWSGSLSSLTQELEYKQEVEDDVSMLYSINTSAMSYDININFEVCQTVNETNVCDILTVVSNFPLYKSNCSSTVRKRRRKSVVDDVSSEIMSALKDMYARKAPSKEVNEFLNGIKNQAKLIRDEAFKTLNIDDSDSGTKLSSLVKALGKNNPMSIVHADQDTELDLDVKGAQAIGEILSDTATAIGKGAQLYVAGSGLTANGVRRLGKQFATMTIGDLEGLLELNRVDPKDIQKLILDIVELAKTLYADAISPITSGKLGNAFKDFDIELRGRFDFPRMVQNLFTSPPIVIWLGPVVIIFRCGADYYLGMNIGAGVKIMGMKTDVTVTPYGGLSVWGSASFGYILYADIRLTGYIMDIRMPTRAELDFSRFPLDVGLKMDLVLRPLQLELRGLVTLTIKIPLCCKFPKVLFKATIWRSKSQSISKNIINSIKDEKDDSPPQFNSLAEGPQRRSIGSPNECVVKQLEGLDYTEPTFEISVDAIDDKSQVKFFLDVGTYPGGTDTLREFQLGGALTKLAMTLRHTGVPLYFTLHAQNSQGSRASATCTLKAYDVTVPSGRVKAEFLSSSNPHVFKALVTAHDESDLTQTNAAMGYGEELYGDQIVPWHNLQLDEVSYELTQDVNDPDEILVHFSGMTNGKLIGGVLHTKQNVHKVSDCAIWCLSFPKHSCLSINYDFGKSGTCEILKAIEGHDHIIVKDGLFTHYERLGTGLSVQLERTNLNLLHNFLYKGNLHMVNTLQYTNVISSEGILIDLTTPEPGTINNMKSSTLDHVPCLTLLPGDRHDLKRFCVGLDHTTSNHRVIADGPNSKTVFNGRHELHDELYTRINNYISANWDGFHDNETSIRVYAWAVGMEICQELIQPHEDPHGHLADESQWNHKGQIYPIQPPYTILPDGPYYVTVRALNGVEYGGPLSVTVCHTTPYIVDTSPPHVDEIYNIRYDEKSYFVYADIAIRDQHSGILEYDVCLGRTSRECDLLNWFRYDIDAKPAVSHRFQIPDGVPAWLRIRAVNNVQLSTVGVASQAIVVDESAPFPGKVDDGETYKTDLVYSKDPNKICVNWNSFYDPESGISSYLVGIGSKPGITDVIHLNSVSYKEHHVCLQVTGQKSLVDESTYYAIVYAINGGIVKRNASAVSNGVTIDLSPPVAGIVVDGTSEADWKYSSSESVISAQWRDFNDPDSDIAEYAVKVLMTRSSTSNVLKNWTQFEPTAREAVWKNAHLNHKDYIQTMLQVTNGATNEITRKTDGYLVDLTAPVSQYIHDGKNREQDIQFQTDASVLTVSFDIEDPESGLRSLKFQIHERYNGHKTRIWPDNETWHEETNTDISSFQRDGLYLIPGAKYSVVVASENNARITSTHETDGVIIDTSPPSVRWFHVGVFSGENEDTHNGYVYQADHTGIKLSFLAFDHQSGISNVIIKIGTSKGSDDIKAAESYSATKRDLYISGLQLEDTIIQTMSPVYHMTIQIQNGAGQSSNEVYSTPIVVVPEDVPGNVADGIVRTDDIFEGDIDYSFDHTTMAITFDGFKSTLHGIKTFVWAVGTAPDREDVVPFTANGLVFEENFDTIDNSMVYSGTAHLPTMLEHGKLYFVTIRGITHGGHALQSITDGILIDKSPPQVTFERLLNHELPDPNASVYYETSLTSLSGSWIYQDNEMISVDVVDNIGMVMARVGTVPDGANALPTKYWINPGSNVGDISDVYINTNGLPSFLTVTVENKAGLSTTIVSQAVVVDDTAPEPGKVTCSRFAQPKTPIHCEWSGFTDMESPLTHYKFYLGSTPGDVDVMDMVHVPVTIQEYFINDGDVTSEHGDIYFTTVVAINSVDKEAAAFSEAIYIDTTPPTPGTVVELPHEFVVQDGETSSNYVNCNSQKDCLSHDITCQKSLTSISVAFSPFEDEESGIRSYYIGVGTSDREADILNYQEIPELISKRTYTIKGINLMGLRKVYVSVMAVNGAGLSSVSWSNGVFISYISQDLNPLSHIGIWDADNGVHGDIDYQVDSSTMSAAWDTTGEPCPAVKYEWKIERLDGEVMQDYVDKQEITSGYNDQLNMRNGETYYSVLRVTNADGYVYVLRSDGVTIHNQPLVPGTVYDGDVFGYDLNVLPSTQTVTCNWNGFGVVTNVDREDVLTGNQGVDQDIPENQHISSYEVALGTDRRFQSTRSNIVPFTNVNTNTSHTFKQLELRPGTAKYYCTVNAYSSSLSKAQSMSNGFFITLNGGVTVGEIKMPAFTASLTTLEIPWQGFTSKEDMMLYYVAVSTHFKPISGDCKQYIDGGNATDKFKASLFNVQPLTNVGSSTLATFKDLSLFQGHIYYVIVMGVDRAGECNMTSANTTIDVTDPDRGLVTGGPYFGMRFICSVRYIDSSGGIETYLSIGVAFPMYLPRDLSFTSDEASLRVKWSGYKDDVSGIVSYTVSLWYGLSCENDTINKQIGETFSLGGDILTFTFTDNILESSMPYYAKLVVENGAGLSITDMTEPILLDKSTPTAGLVVEGEVFTDNIVWWGSTSEFTVTVLHYPTPTGAPCPSQNIPVNDSSWASVERSKLLDDDGSDWNTVFNPAFITFDNLTNTVKVKMAKDSKTNKMQSGGYWRIADLETSGSYEVTLKAASEIDQDHNNVVTEILFVDGIFDSPIHSYYFREEYDWSNEDCSCCFDEPGICSCSNCTAYLESLSADENAIESKSEMNRKQTCGFQIYSGPEPFGILWCQFIDSAIPIMNIKLNLPFDVALSFYRYRLTFHSVKEDAAVQKCVIVYINGYELGSLCGIPSLSTTTNFLLHVWNSDRFVPHSDDALFTWSVYAEVKSVVFPPAVGQLCRYGDPFRGGDISIVRYEAAIGSEPGLSDIQPFEEVFSPCIPCTDTCFRYNCDEECDEKELSQLVFTLQNLNLQSLKEIGNDSELITNYVTVKAVLGSGNSAVSSSDGFYVDITPPTFDELVLIYIDVDQGDYTPVEYQGSNRTIKAIWLCNDDENEIQEYKWAIGSEIGLEDIQPPTSTGKSPSGQNDMLEGVLENAAHYYISVMCTNEAGLTTRYEDNKGVVVLLEGPDPDSGGGHIEGADPFDYPIEPHDAMKTSNPTSVGATWEVSEDPSVQRYDFCLGSSNDVPNDILGYVWVGYNTSGEVKIEDGRLLYNGEKMYDLNELRTDDTASATGGTFNMEPGRVIFVSIRMCNKAERCTHKHIGTVTIVTSSTSSGVSDGTGSFTLTTSGAGDRRRREVDDRQERSVATTVEVTTPPGLLEGQTVLVVSLTDEDLATEYTSSASSNFVPYVVNPNTTFDNVERVLFGRIVEFETSFTVVTVGQFEMTGPMTITHTQVTTNPQPGDNIHSLVHWNTVDQEWKMTDLTCQFENNTLTQNELNQTTTIKVCNTRRYGLDSDVYFQEETQFAVVLAKADITNNAPSLVSPSSLSFNEDQDGGYVYQLSANDTEGDEIGFLLTNHDYGTIVNSLYLTENGSLNFELCAHCFGTFTLEVQIYDIPQSAQVTSNSTTITIDIAISPVNDQPIIFLVDDNKNSLLQTDVTEEVKIFRNNKIGESVSFTAKVGAYDYDSGDSLAVIHSVTSQGGTYTVEEIQATYTSIVNCNDSWCLGKVTAMAPSAMQWTFSRISYIKNSNYTGTDTIKVAVRDLSGALSDVITVSVYNLDFPCLNGGLCSANTIIPCDNEARLTNFDDNYSCTCPVGWVGKYCGEDVDECQTMISPCSTPMVCKNTAGSYVCEIALYFIIPVMLGVLLVGVAVTVFVCRNKILRSVKKGDTNSNFGSQLIQRLFPKEPAVYPTPPRSHKLVNQETSFMPDDHNDTGQGGGPHSGPSRSHTERNKIDLARRNKAASANHMPRFQPKTLNAEHPVQPQKYTSHEAHPMPLQKEVSNVTIRSINVGSAFKEDDITGHQFEDEDRFFRHPKPAPLYAANDQGTRNVLNIDITGIPFKEKKIVDKKRHGREKDDGSGHATPRGIVLSMEEMDNNNC